MFSLRYIREGEKAKAQWVGENRDENVPNTTVAKVALMMSLMKMENEGEIGDLISCFVKQAGTFGRHSYGHGMARWSLSHNCRGRICLMRRALSQHLNARFCLIAWSFAIFGFLENNDERSERKCTMLKAKCDEIKINCGVGFRRCALSDVTIKAFLLLKSTPRPIRLRLDVERTSQDDAWSRFFAFVFRKHGIWRLNSFFHLLDILRAGPKEPFSQQHTLSSEVVDGEMIDALAYCSMELKCKLPLCHGLWTWRHVSQLFNR